MLHRCSPSVRL